MNPRNVNPIVNEIMDIYLMLQPKNYNFIHFKYDIEDETDTDTVILKLRKPSITSSAQAGLWGALQKPISEVTCKQDETKRLALPSNETISRYFEFTISPPNGLNNFCEAAIVYLTELNKKIVKQLIQKPQDPAKDIVALTTPRIDKLKALQLHEYLRNVSSVINRLSFFPAPVSKMVVDYLDTTISKNTLSA